MDMQSPRWRSVISTWSSVQRDLQTEQHEPQMEQHEPQTEQHEPQTEQHEPLTEQHEPQTEKCDPQPVIPKDECCCSVCGSQVHILICCLLPWQPIGSSYFVFKGQLLSSRQQKKNVFGLNNNK